MASSEAKQATYNHDQASKSGGLSLDQLEDLLSDIRFQPEWRSDADVCEDYYDSHQLKAERLAQMELLGIPPLITNLIAPVINSVLGLEVKSRTDWRVDEADEAQESPAELILALNSKLNEAERETRADMAISEAYASMVKTGVGWVEVSRESDPLAFPYRAQAVHRNEIWWDWMAQRPDLSDMRYLIRKRRFDKDVLKALMPEHSQLIEYAIMDKFGSWQTETTDIEHDTGLAMAAHQERVTNIDSTDWRDAERGRATVYEVWYRRWVRKDFFQLQTGKLVQFDKKDPAQVQAVKMGFIKPIPKAFPEVRVAFFLGCHRLYDVPSPYPHRHFPYVPFFGYKESRSGIRYGMIRAMISPQDVVNSADAKMHWLLSAKRVTADSDAIDTQYNSWAQVQSQLARPDSVVLLDPSKPTSRYKVESDFQLNAQQFSRRMQAAQDIEALGVAKATLGRDSNATSGVAIESLISQDSVVMSELNDNYSFGRRMVGELLFSLVKEDLSRAIGMPVPIKQEGKKSIVTLNQRTVNEQTGEEVKQNDVAGVDVKVVLEDIPSTASFKQQQLRVLSEVVKALPPEMQAITVPSMIKLTDIPDKEEISEQIKRMLGQGKKLTDDEQAVADQQAQQVQAEVAELQRRTAEANVKLLEAKVADLEKKTEKTDAERLVKMVEAMYSAMQSAQLVATVPGVAPVADEILKGAGYADVGGEMPEIDQGLQAQQPPPVEQPAPDGVTSLQESQPESPVDGIGHGIETIENDGVQLGPQGFNPPAQA